MKKNNIDTEDIVDPIVIPTPKNEMSMYTKVIVLCILICTGLALFFYTQVRGLEQNPNKANEKKITEVVEKVGKLIDLPAGELPTLAVVSDATVLSRQPFFKRAKVGDQVLLYAAARQAYLYDPVANIILEVASLNLNQ